MGPGWKPKTMKFVRGHPYSRREIHDQLGGSVQCFLPFVGGRVVAACLCPILNPLAPRQILAGDAPGVLNAGRLLARQPGPIPVFLKCGSAQWAFEGMFAVAETIEDPTRCAIAAASAERADPVRLVIALNEWVPSTQHHSPGDAHCDG